MTDVAGLPPTALRGTPDFRASAALRGLAGFASAGLGLSALGAAGIGVPCPWREVTGTLCPLCGSTRLGVSLLRLDVAGAAAANPFVLGLLAVLALLGAVWAVEARGGPAVRLPRRVTRTPDRWWLALGVLAVTWAVLRNVW